MSRADAVPANPFAARFPHLFHVTRRSALERIGREGVLCAHRLAGGSGAAPADGNREDWTRCGTANGAVAWLRWQSLRDPVLMKRLPPELSPAAWRGLINGMVFLFASRAKADALRAFPRDAGIDQVILRVSTDALIAAGLDLRVCRWNNGYPDRGRPPRLRRPSDYRPAAAWRPGEPVAEVTVEGGIPPSVAFELVD